MDRNVTALGKWLTVREMAASDWPPLARTRKTQRWEIRGSDASIVGWVEWYSPWRQYAFVPSGQSIVLNRTCLRDLADFCETRAVT